MMELLCLVLEIALFAQHGRGNHVYFNSPCNAVLPQPVQLSHHKPYIAHYPMGNGGCAVKWFLRN